MKPDRRDREMEEFQRKTLKSPILISRVKEAEKGRVFFGYAKNISRGGLFIQTINPKKESEKYKIEFTLPGKKKPVTCTSKVIWKREYLPNARYEPGMGLKFVDIKEKNAQEIDEWVKMSSGSVYYY